ncbi:MAG: hypothetical protein ABSC48_02810 [Terracidiphilus sp.]|jgi:hypothetical protein
MKKVLFSMLLMLPALAWAEKKPAANPADYTVAVHVQSSQVIDRFQMATQLLDVIIDGKKYELEAWHSFDVLPVGDYKAKKSQEKIFPNHDYSRRYELLFADGTTRSYAVVGESE